MSTIGKSVKVNVTARCVVLRPAPKRVNGRETVAHTIRFHNKRELWQGQKAARKLNVSFNSYIRALMLEHSDRVLGRLGRE